MNARERPDPHRFLDRIDRLPVNCARRTAAALEYRRAEVTATRIVAIFERLGERAQTLHRAFRYRHHRTG